MNNFDLNINVPNNFLEYYEKLEKEDKLIKVNLDLDEELEKLFSKLSDVEKAWIIYKGLTKFIASEKNYKEVTTIFELENIKELLNNINSEKIIIFDENLKEIGILEPIKERNENKN